MTTAEINTVIRCLGVVQAVMVMAIPIVLAIGFYIDTRQKS